MFDSHISMKRVMIAELLDTDSGSPAEVEGSLADLRWFNRWFGGISTTHAMVQEVAGKLGASSLSWLEVATGSGDVPAAVRQRMEGAGVRLDVTTLDRARSHLSNNHSAVVGDALALPFADASFDIVGCGLFAHHLSPQQLVQFVNEGLRVCRVAMLINDLQRHALHLAVAYAGLPLYRSRLTRHDAPASVRQAYTPEEICSLLQPTPAARVEIHHQYLFRMGVIVWRK